MDPLGISPLMIFFFFPPFSIPHFTHLQQFQWAFCGRKRTKVDITDQIRLFYDEIWTPLAMRTELTCSHEDMKTRLLFSHLLTAAMTTTTAYLYLQLPVLCTYSKLCNCGSRDCRLDQSVPRSLFLFANFLMVNQEWRSATRGFSQIWLQDKTRQEVEKFWNPILHVGESVKPIR
jgi:hypothetical protein